MTLDPVAEEVELGIAVPLLAEVTGMVIANTKLVHEHLECLRLYHLN